MNNRLNVKDVIRNNIETIIPIIHFLLTFLWEKSLFLFSENNWDIFLSVAKNNYISNYTESLIVYIISKLFAGILIYSLWKLIFAILKKKISKSKVVLFGIIYLAGFIVGFFLFPSTFALEVDNYTNYAQVIRFLPTYWQSIYTGIVYAGCMMVVPHPFSIFLFQWLSFVMVIAYIYSEIENLVKNEIYKYIVLILFILPESYYIMFNAYRNNFYTILCLFYFAYLFFSTQERKYSLKEIVILSILSAFIMVWRSEGILIGGGV